MKIKRNEVCPCQSGKKYKKCCLFKMEEKNAECDRINEHLDAGNEIAHVKKDIERLYAQFPDDHMVNFLCGICYCKEEQFTYAISHFEKAISLCPSFGEAFYNLGLLYIHEARIPESIMCFDRLIGIEGEYSDLSVLAQQELDRLESFIKESSGLTLDAYVNNNMLFDLAFVCLQNEEYEEAVLFFQEVLSVDPRHVQSYSNIALAYSALGQNTLALECLDKAIALDPSYEPALSNKRTIVQLGEGEKNKASKGWIEYYKQKWKKGKQP